MTEIYLLNQLSSTTLKDHDSFDSIIILEDREVKKFKTVKYIDNGILRIRLNKISFNYKLGVNETIKSYLVTNSYKSENDFSIIKTNVIPGHYYPRIYRPLLMEKNYFFYENGEHVGDANKHEKLITESTNMIVDLPYEHSHLLNSINQLSTLKELLISIFSTVSPIQNENLLVYGPKIKDLILLACIEVENHLKGIIKANELNQKDNYTTKDYVKLKDILHLENYSVKLNYYPNLPNFSPFNGWDSKNPTKSLDWYDAYNGIKHNSENEFHRATLINSINSICAVVILIKSQYGEKIEFWHELIGNFFEVQNHTNWDINEKILPPEEGNVWIEKKMLI